MNNLLKHLRSLNPKTSEQSILIYGSRYKLHQEGKYIGEATWTQDENIGDSFQTEYVDENGRLASYVYIADQWELIIEKPLPPIPNK